MIKKALIAGSTVCLVSGLFFGRDAASYVGTSAGWVKDSVKQSVPIEFEIERARREIHNIVPAIRQNMHVIAKEEIEVERLDKQIAAADQKLGRDKAEIVRLSSDLKTGDDHFTYASRRYTGDQVKLDLSNRFARYQTNEATLGSLREIHRARKHSLEMARQKLEQMLAQRHQLAAEVENLEARLKTLEVAKSTSQYCFDDSQLGRVKQLISDVKQRLDVDERLLSSEGYFQDEIPLEEATQTENIVDQVTEYFSNGAANGEPAAEVALSN
jgi:chromosome segregation ATPase